MPAHRCLVVLRRLVRRHTLLLAGAALVLLLAPGAVLGAVGVGAPALPVVALTRVLAAALAVAAAAVLPLPALPAVARGPAFGGVAAAYGVAAALVLAQQVAIWSRPAGAAVAAVALGLAGAFAACAVAARRPGLAEAEMVR